jgi:serpin B
MSKLTKVISVVMTLSLVGCSSTESINLQKSSPESMTVYAVNNNSDKSLVVSPLSYFKTIGAANLYRDEKDSVSTNPFINSAMELESTSGIESHDLVVLSDKLTKAKNIEQLNNIFAIDFTAADASLVLNNWVSEKTKGKVKDLFSGELSALKLAIVNTVYFRSQWSKPFDEYLTNLESFTKSDGNTVELPFMSDTRDVQHFNDELVSSIKLDFNDEFEATFTTSNTLVSKTELMRLAKNIEESQYTSSEAYISLPKFKLKSRHEFIDYFNKTETGYQLTQSQVPFPKLTPETVKISSLMQVATLEIDEVGAEGAAATSLLATKSLVSKRFVFNKPFILTITSKKDPNVTVFWVLFDGSEM